MERPQGQTLTMDSSPHLTSKHTALCFNVCPSFSIAANRKESPHPCKKNEPWRSSSPFVPFCSCSYPSKRLTKNNDCDNAPLVRTLRLGGHSAWADTPLGRTLRLGGRYAFQPRGNARVLLPKPALTPPSPPLRHFSTRVPLSLSSKSLPKTDRVSLDRLP